MRRMPARVYPPARRLRVTPAASKRRGELREAHIDALNLESERTGERAPDAARRAALEAYRLAAHADYGRGMADSLLNQGRLHAHAADYARALESFHAAFLGYQRSGLLDKLPLLQRKLGNIHLVTGQYAKAEACFNRSLAFSRKSGAAGDEVISLRQLGIVEQFRGRFPAAAARYQEALQRANAIGDRNQAANALLDLGSLRLESGDPGNAMVAYERCRVEWRALGDKIGLAQVSCNMGMALMQLKRHAEAERELRAALATAHASKAARLKLNVLVNLGELFTASGRADEAGRYLNRGLRIARLQKDRHIELGLQLNLARLTEGRKRIGAARKQFAAAAILAGAIGEAEALAEARAGLARLGGASTV